MLQGDHVLAWDELLLVTHISLSGQVSVRLQIRFKLVGKVVSICLVVDIHIECVLVGLVCIDVGLLLW